MMQKCLVALLSLVLVVMTAWSGTMRGVVQNDGNRVQFNYSDSQIGSANLQVVMPEGERFEGRVERGTERTQPNFGATAS